MANSFIKRSFTYSDYFVMQTTRKDNITIGANTYIASESFSVAKEGYTPIGLVGYALNNASSSGENVSYCSIRTAYLSGNTVYFSARNHYSSAAKVAFNAYVLYVKTENY